MKFKEAIKILKVHNGKCSGCDKLCNDLYRPAVELAITALEEIQQYHTIFMAAEYQEAMKKQMPKKPQMQEPYYADGESVYLCPVCSEFVFRASKIMHTKSNQANYCTNCGQKLDWSVL